MFEPVAQIKEQDWMTAPETVAVMTALGNARFVGGCVRNTLLGLPPGDVDIATPLTPDEVIGRLTGAGLRAVPTGIDHGTVTAVSNGVPFEITTLRRDVATDGRRAVVAFTKDWAEDAQRRDFTMNTLLADAEGRVYDPTGQGLADLKAARVVFVGEARQRIAEDYLRILRFFRFHAFYGKGAPDEGALKACREEADKIATLSRERITQEVLKLLSVDDPVDHLELMFRNRVLTALAGPGYDPEALRRLCALQTRHSLSDMMARLVVLGGDFDGILLLSNRQRKIYEGIRTASAELKDVSGKNSKSLIYKEGKDISIQSVLIFCARKNSDSGVVEKLKDWPIPSFPLGGDDVLKAGVKPGPDVGRVLSAVEEWWLGNDFQPDRAACLEKLKTIL